MHFPVKGRIGPRTLASCLAHDWEHPPRDERALLPDRSGIFVNGRASAALQTMNDQNPGIPGQEEDDLTEEMVSSARRKNRLNAIVLLLVFALLTFAPQPWAALAPFLLVIPLAYSATERVRRGASSASKPQLMGGITRLEPYTREPRGPEDPRRYKPIG